MTTRTRMLIGGAFAAAVVAGGSLGLNLRATSQARADRLEAERAAARFERDAQVAEAERSVALSRKTELERELAVLQRTKPAAVASVPATGKRPPAPSLSIIHLIRDEPDAQVAYLKSVRAGLIAKYGPLFRELALSPGQVNAFYDHVLARDEKMMDLQNLAREEGADIAAIGRVQRTVSAEYESAQRTLLGEVHAKRWQAYERTSPVRDMVAAVAGVAVLEGAPIDAVQAEHVVQIIAQASERYRSGGVAMFDAVNWPDVEPQIREVLTPVQFEILRTMDPGPTAGGLSQVLLYAAVERAKAADRAAASLVAKNKGTAAPSP